MYQVQAQDSSLSFGGHYSFIDHDPLKSFKIRPKGTGFHGRFSQRSSVFGFEAHYKTLNATADVRYDGTQDVLNHKQTGIGFGLQTFFTKKFFGRFGMSWTTVKHSFDGTPSADQKAILQSLWQLSSEDKKSGLYWGLQYNIIHSRHWDLHLNYTSQKIMGSATEQQIGLGISIKVDFNIQSILSGRVL